jgi:sugar/nucleoside kinase (ribokinase family)
MGRFIREQMEREGVATAGIRTDPQRLTALVILGVRDDKTFPLIFYRENCADMALEEATSTRRSSPRRRRSWSPVRTSRGRTPPRRR